MMVLGIYPTCSLTLFSSTPPPTPHFIMSISTLQAWANAESRKANEQCVTARNALSQISSEHEVAASKYKTANDTLTSLSQRLEQLKHQLIAETRSKQVKRQRIEYTATITDDDDLYMQGDGSKEEEIVIIAATENDTVMTVEEKAKEQVEAGDRAKYQAEVEDCAKYQDEVEAEAEKELPVEAEAKYHDEVEVEVEKELPVEAEAKYQDEVEAEAEKEDDVEAEAKYQDEVEAEAEKEDEVEVEVEAEKENEIEVKTNTENEPPVDKLADVEMDPEIEEPECKSMESDKIECRSFVKAPAVPLRDFIRSVTYPSFGGITMIRISTEKSKEDGIAKTWPSNSQYTSKVELAALGAVNEWLSKQPGTTVTVPTTLSAPGAIAESAVSEDSKVEEDSSAHVITASTAIMRNAMRIFDKIVISPCSDGWAAFPSKHGDTTYGIEATVTMFKTRGKSSNATKAVNTYLIMRDTEGNNVFAEKTVASLITQTSEGTVCGKTDDGVVLPVDDQKGCFVAQVRGRKESLMKDPRRADTHVMLYVNPSWIEGRAPGKGMTKSREQAKMIAVYHGMREYMNETDGDTSIIDRLMIRLKRVMSMQDIDMSKY